MQIQCPHCKSRYRFGSEMIDAYGGFVRCGNCNYKFNIHDQVILDDGQGGLINTGIRPGQNKSQVTKASASTASSNGARIEPRLERDEQEDEFNIRFGWDEEELNAESSENSETREPQLEPLEQSLKDDDSEDFQFPESLDALEALDTPIDNEFSESFDELMEQSLEDDSSVEVLDAAVTEPRSELGLGEEPVVFDSLHDDDEEEGSARLALINDDAQDEGSAPGFFRNLFSMLWNAIQFLFWGAAAIALAYLLFGQIKETLYPAYKNHSLVQQMRSGVCAYLPCDNASYDIDLFEIVVSRMDEINEPSRQLHISIFLLNNAKQAQAYPNILLALKTIDGSTVGQRVIRPEEYFTSYDSLISSSADSPGVAGMLVKPNKLGKILIKLDNPPANAVGFEVRVVK